MPVPLLTIPGGTSPGLLVPGYAVPGTPVMQDSYVIFDAPGINDRDGRWYGSVLTNDITIQPNPEIGTSASMFLDNGAGQVYEFYSDASGNFGVFDKTYFKQTMLIDDTGFAQFFGTLSGQGLILNVVTTATSYTVSFEDYLVLANGASAVTLPTAAGSATGQLYVIKNIAAGTVTVNTTSSQTIDGAASYTLPAQYRYVTVASDGSNWFVVASN